jgi:hypothetical protein
MLKFIKDILNILNYKIFGCEPPKEDNKVDIKENKLNIANQTDVKSQVDNIESLSFLGSIWNDIKGIFSWF